MQRADVALVERGLVASRNRAQEAIKSGFVLIDGEVLQKPSLNVEAHHKLLLKEPLYPSRAGLKLKGFLDAHGLAMRGEQVIDIGASKGGFTQVALDYGAKSVTCVDVGSAQLDAKLCENPRVKVYENTDIRDFKTDFCFDTALCDLSFIPLEMVLGSIDRLFQTRAILLFKPQFEVGRDAKRTKKGVVSDDSIITAKREEFIEQCLEMGWVLEYESESKLKGKEGNREFFQSFKKGDQIPGFGEV